jgi:hypothetical protein
VKKNVYVGRGVKVWIFIILCSLLVWTLYWVPWSFSLIYRFIISQGAFFRFGGLLYLVQELSGASGTIIRSVGVLIGLYIMFLLRDGKKEIYDAKKLLASALVIESIYYALLGFPSGIYMMSGGYGGQTRVLGVSFFLQFLFTTPFLAVLAVKVYRYEKNVGFQSWNWVGAAFVGYIATLWSNSVPKWFEMLAMEGSTFFSIPIRTVGFLNDFVFMTLAIVFAVVGAYYLVKKRSFAIRWSGLALAILGLHYLVYVVYSYYGGMLDSVMLAEVWAIPLLGLGLAMLTTNSSKTKSEM